MTAAEQPTLDLGEYRGKNIVRTSVRLQNTNDGFHPSTDMDEPRIFELEEELTVAIRIRVTGHHPKLIEKGEDDEIGLVELLQDFKCGTIAIIPDTGAVKKELDRVESQRKAAETAAKKAKDAAKKAKDAAKKAKDAAKKRAPRGKADVVPISSSLQQVSDGGEFTV